RPDAPADRGATRPGRARRGRDRRRVRRQRARDLAAPEGTARRGAGRGPGRRATAHLRARPRGSRRDRGVARSRAGVLGGQARCTGAGAAQAHEEEAMSEYGSVIEPGTVRFERLLPGPIEKVWAHLIDAEIRGTWLATGPMEPREGGKVELHFCHAD